MKAFTIKIRFTLALSLLTALSLPALAQEVWTIGPMVHMNFGGEKKRLSYAIEVAYWNVQNFYYSVDGGLEFEHKKVRIYSEIQAGVVLTGVSCGPLLEINREERKVSLGFQASAWANLVVGADFRRRWVGGKAYNCPGLYTKIPFYGTGRYSGLPFETKDDDDYDYDDDDWDWD